MIEMMKRCAGCTLIAALAMGPLASVAHAQEIEEPGQDVRNVLLTFHLVEADGFADEDPEISDVVSQLRNLFNFRGYRLLSTSVFNVGLVRNSSGSFVRGDGSQRVQPDDSDTPLRIMAEVSSRALHGDRPSHGDPHGSGDHAGGGFGGFLRADTASAARSFGHDPRWPTGGAGIGPQDRRGTRTHPYRDSQDRSVAMRASPGGHCQKRRDDPGVSTLPMPLALVLAAVTLATGSACSDAVPAGPSVEVETIGDTTIVRTLSGSAWGAEASLVPEVSIGQLEGPDEYLFGRIGSMAVDEARNVYVFDQQSQQVRVFDAAGRHVETLGRDGEGPGEFARAETIAVLPDGRVLVRDPGNMRVQVFARASGGRASGETEEWEYNSGNSYRPGAPLYTDCARPDLPVDQRRVPGRHHHPPRGRRRPPGYAPRTDDGL